MSEQTEDPSQTVPEDWEPHSNLPKSWREHRPAPRTRAKTPDAGGWWDTIGYIFFMLALFVFVHALSISTGYGTVNLDALSQKQNGFLIALGFLLFGGLCLIIYHLKHLSKK